MHGLGLNFNKPIDQPLWKLQWDDKSCLAAAQTVRNAIQRQIEDDNHNAIGCIDHKELARKPSLTGVNRRTRQPPALRSGKGRIAGNRTMGSASE